MWTEKETPWLQLLSSPNNRSTTWSENLKEHNIEQEERRNVCEMKEGRSESRTKRGKKWFGTVRRERVTLLSDEVRTSNQLTLQTNNKQTVKEEHTAMNKEWTRKQEHEKKANRQQRAKLKLELQKDLRPWDCWSIRTNIAKTHCCDPKHIDKRTCAREISEQRERRARRGRRGAARRGAGMAASPRLQWTFDAWWLDQHHPQ